tara:strand:+ start:254 stop:529 length:276 start_codon:yes stop_codon:yes gene_type:complete
MIAKIAQAVIKLILPDLYEKVGNYVAKLFKLPQMLDYMELPNEADKRIDKLEEQFKMVIEDSNPSQELEERIAELELFTKKIKNKKAFKKL